MSSLNLLGETMQPFVDLLLCRHTETDLNIRKVYSGTRMPAQLNEVGLRQAKELAELLASLDAAAIFASDLGRTQTVARILSARLDLRVVTDSRLREVDVGAMSGLTKDQARERFPEAHFRTSGREYDFTSIGGESRVAVVARQRECFQAILALHGVLPNDTRARPIVVVGHGTSLRSICEEYGHDPKEFHKQGAYQALRFSSVI